MTKFKIDRLASMLTKSEVKIKLQLDRFYKNNSLIFKLKENIVLLMLAQPYRPENQDSIADTIISMFTDPK